MTDEKHPDADEAQESSERAASDAPDEQTDAASGRPLKKDLREGAAKAWGYAVEVGSMLTGQSGEIVDAERKVAEAEAEDFLDKIDGEG